MHRVRWLRQNLETWLAEVSVDKRKEALFRAINLALMRGVTAAFDFERYLSGTTQNRCLGKTIPVW